MGKSIIGNRVAFITNASGADDLTVDGEVAGRLSPGEWFDDGAAVRYYVEDVDGESWEEREGTYRTGPERIVRGTLLDSPTDAAIVLSGTPGKTVFVDAPPALLGPEAGRLRIATTAGTTTAYTLDLPVPSGVLKDGVEFTAIIHADNTSADVTLKEGVQVAKTIKAGLPRRKPAIGALKTGAAVIFRYDQVNDLLVAIAGLIRTIKTVSTATYTVLEEDHEQKLVFTNAGGCAVALPQATGQFAAPFWFDYSGQATFTPTTSTINQLTSFTASAGQTGRVEVDSTGNYLATALGGTANPAVVASARDLVGANGTSPNTQVVYSATEIVLKDAYGAARVVSLQGVVDISLNGVNGLDTGVEAASTWYYAWAIDLATPIAGAAVTANASTDRISHPAHGLPANKAVKIGGTAAPAGLTLGQVVFIRDVTSTDYKVAATPNGAAIDLTSTGTAVTITTVPDIVLSLGVATPSMPAGYTFKALLGCWYNDSSSNLRSMVQYGRETNFDRIVALSGAAPTTAGVLQSLSLSNIVPPLALVAIGFMGSDQNANAASLQVAANASGIGRRQFGNTYAAANLLDGLYSAGGFEVPITSPQSIWWTSTSTNTQNNIRISGFRF